MLLQAFIKSAVQMVYRFYGKSIAVEISTHAHQIMSSIDSPLHMCVIKG